MTDKDKKNEGPTCACGRVDIYEEMLKNQKNKEEVSDYGMADKEGEDNISTEDSSRQDQKTD
jgi:hypothetical protein